LNYTQEELDLITLASLDELTYLQKKSLLSDLTSPTPDFVKDKKSLIKSLSRGVYNKVREKYFSDEYREELMLGLEEAGVSIVTCFSENYPKLLRNTDVPPLVLYCKGNVSLLKTDCFAVVGSRKTLAQPLAECKKISKELTRHFTVVSGIAKGADAAALEGALESGKVISVLANGFNYFYPPENRSLTEKVAERGLLVSEYPPDVAPKKYYFPVRNRIIAGISKGVLVVSAGIKSGALITAHYADVYNRNIYAFPYNLGVTSGEGCNFLIKNKAKLTENTLDIFCDFGLDFKPQEEEKLSAEEEKLLAAIRELGEAFLPDVAEKLGVFPFRLMPVVSKLEIKGLIVRLGGNRYAAV